MQASDDTSPRTTPRHLAACLVVYLASQALAFALTIQPENISLFWPPAGVMLGCLLRVARRDRPALAALLALATTIANLAVGRGFALSLALAINDTAVGVGGAWIYTAWAAGAPILRSSRNLLLLLAVAVLGAVVSASVGAALIRASFATAYWPVWRLWVPAMILGVLLTTPAVLSWHRSSVVAEIRAAWIEAGAAAALMLAAAALAYLTPTTASVRGALVLVLLPPMVWVALRRGAFEIGALVFATATIAVWGDAHGRPPDDPAAALWRDLHLQADLIILAITAFFLRSTTDERRLLEQSDRDHLTALHESERRFRSLVELNPDAIIVVESGRVAYANPAAVALLGGTRAEPLVGRESIGLVHPDDRALIAERALRIAQSGRTAPLEAMRWLRLDGATIDVEAVSAPIAWHGRHAIQVIARDVTAKRAAERDLTERDRLIHTILETTTAAVVTIDERGVIQAANSGAERMFGYAMTELIGGDVAMLMAPELGARHDLDLKRYLGTGKSRIVGTTREVAARRKDGSIFPVEISIGETIVHGQRIFTGFMRDISARQEAGRRIHALQAELGQVGRRTAMGEFASVLAHELNQPLAALTNYATAAQELTAGSPIDHSRLASVVTKITQQIARAREVVRRMRRLVERRGLERSNEHLHAVITEALELALIGRDQPPIAVDYAPPRDLPRIAIDRIQIQQVLINLIRNAAEAMRDTTRRVLTICVAEVEGREIVISVRDTGRGVPPELADHLFESFVTTGAGGMGLGLSISRSIAEAHGGRLWFEPVANGGAVFRLALPLDDGAPAAH